MAFAVDVVCEFVNLSVCVGVLNQILSNCRLNLVRNLIICSLNLAKFNHLLSLAWVLCWNLTKQTQPIIVNLNFLWVYKFMVRVRVPWAKFHLIGCWTWREKYSFNKCPLQIFWLLLFYLELNLARNFFVYSLNL